MPDGRVVYLSGGHDKESVLQIISAAEMFPTTSELVHSDISQKMESFQAMLDGSVRIIDRNFAVVYKKDPADQTWKGIWHMDISHVTSKLVDWFDSMSMHFQWISLNQAVAIQDHGVLLFTIQDGALPNEVEV